MRLGQRLLQVFLLFTQAMREDFVDGLQHKPGQRQATWDLPNISKSCFQWSVACWAIQYILCFFGSYPYLENQSSTFRKVTLTGATEALHERARLLSIWRRFGELVRICLGMWPTSCDRFQWTTQKETRTHLKGSWPIWRLRLFEFVASRDTTDTWYCGLKLMKLKKIAPTYQQYARPTSVAPMPPRNIKVHVSPKALGENEMVKTETMSFCIDRCVRFQGEHHSSAVATPVAPVQWALAATTREAAKVRNWAELNKT